MTDARDINAIIIRALAYPSEACGKALMDDTLHDWQTRSVRTALHAAGFRILGPDEVDPVTLDRVAQFTKSDFHRNFESPIGWRDQFATAIRALGRKA